MDKQVKKRKKSVITFISPAGFIEQHYIGAQTGPTVKKGVEADAKFVDKLISEKKEPLILVDLTEVISTDFASHTVAIKGMQQVPFKKIAIYGPFSMQILLNTLAKVADKYNTVRAFGSRVEAIEWLKRK